MKLFIASDAHIIEYNGRYYYATQVSTILKRYYDNFGKFSVCGRVTRTDSFPELMEDVTDMIDEVVEIASFGKALLGMEDKRISSCAIKCDLIVCRCPGVIASRAAKVAQKINKPCFAEAMGCAWDAYWNHGFVGKVIAPYMYCRMKRVFRNADYALYVTNEFLQKRYPCRCESVSASNVLIEKIDENVLSQRLERIRRSDMSEITLMTTAAVNVRYKGQQYVIRAIPKLNAMGIKVKYILVGGGDNTYLKQEAEKYGVLDQIEFRGRVGLEEVFEILDTVDIYIQPSLQEGLPRSVIEAMSRACPVIGAKTAGIPELISPDCVVKRKSAADIANVVKRIGNEEKMIELAMQNFNNSKSYLTETLASRRNRYFERVKGEIGITND